MLARRVHKYALSLRFGRAREISSRRSLSLDVAVNPPRLNPSRASK
jgi:hypothetical protein